jgi:acetate kinase
MRILVLNCGSSSLKFRLLEVGEKPEDANRVLINGAVKGIGGTGSLELSAEGQPKSKTSKPVPDHTQAIQWMFEGLGQLSGGEDHSIDFLQVDAVGHRVVHGGERFSAPTLIDEAVEKEIDKLIELAPLHNPACLAGIRGARAMLDKKVPMVSVFDTAFHQTMPAVAKMYALPYELASRHRIHRYGFHGIAHASLADGYATFTGRPHSDTRIITLQLGNGCSVAAIAGGKSVETSMGFTPLEGLVMGTRSGDLDPSVVTFLAHKEKVDALEVERWLNEDSGLLGLSGRTNDMRELLQAATVEHDERARLAIDIFCYRARKYIGAYLAVLGGADAIIFGGGIGEASPDIRAMICDGMEWCGLRLESGRNRAAIGLQPGQVTHISEDGYPLKVYVVPADEETWIARETVKCLQTTRKA